MRRRGSRTSFDQATFRMDMLISGLYDKSSPATSQASLNATSLPASEDGLTPSSSPIGTATGQSGQDRAHASPSPSPASEPPLKTSETFGQNGEGSSASAALQRYLESKLQERMESCGLIELPKSLNPMSTPSRRPYCQLLASVPDIDGIDFSFMPTPSAQTQQGGMRIEGGSRARATWRAHGRMPTGKAETLAMSAWLMGYPPSWLSASPTDLETQSSPKSLPSSSERR